jgi:hypothetical protein
MAVLLTPSDRSKNGIVTYAAALPTLDYHEIGYPPRFGEMLERLYIAVKDRGLTLIIRDYNYVDFIGIPFIWPVPYDFSLTNPLAAESRSWISFLSDPPLHSSRAYAAIGRLDEF